jgi:hypothetical protein
MISYAVNREGPPFDDSAAPTRAALAVLGFINDLSLERCPEDLAERTIRLLCAAAARSRRGDAHRGHLFLSP